MADEFRLAVDAQDVDFKAYARHFEHPGEEDEPARRAILIVLATLTFPDSGWNVMITPVEGTEFEEWILLEDPPAFRDANRTYYSTSGNTEHETAAVPKTIRVRHGEDKITRVSVVPWD